jgi:hypothetical protein
MGKAQRAHPAPPGADGHGAIGVGASPRGHRGRLCPSYGLYKTDRTGEIPMNSKMNMIYWKSDKFWLGKLLEHPEIMTQGETLEELEENIKEAYLLMALDDVPEQYQMREIAI